MIAEDIGLNNFALQVCVLAEEDASVTITTFADTATGNSCACPHVLVINDMNRI